jgi:hypothetical protein
MNAFRRLWSGIVHWFEEGDLLPLLILVSSVHYGTVLSAHDHPLVAIAIGLLVDLGHYRWVRAASRYNGNSKRERAVRWSLAAVMTAVSLAYHQRFYNDWWLSIPLPLLIASLAWLVKVDRATAGANGATAKAKAERTGPLIERVERPGEASERNEWLLERIERPQKRLSEATERNERPQEGRSESTERNERPQERRSEATERNERPQKRLSEAAERNEQSQERRSEATERDEQANERSSEANERNERPLEGRSEANERDERLLKRRSEATERDERQPERPGEAVERNERPQERLSESNGQDERPQKRNGQMLPAAALRCEQCGFAASSQNALNAHKRGHNNRK